MSKKIKVVQIFRLAGHSLVLVDTIGRVWVTDTEYWRTKVEGETAWRLLTDLPDEPEEES